MIGSISKIRPCGHHHYYKYAHAKDNKDMNSIVPTKSTKGFFDDVDEDGVFHYPLINLTRLYDYAFSGWHKLKWFKDSLSTVTNNFTHLFSGVNGGVEKLNLELKGSSYTAVPGIQMRGSGGTYTYAKRIFELKFPNATSVTSAFQQCYLGNGTNIKVWGPKINKVNGFFSGYGGGQFESKDGINIEIDCSNVTSANNFAQVCNNLKDLSFPIDEDGVHTFGSGKPEIGRKWTTFPKLSTGDNMFTISPHGKEYTLAFLNDLPDWSNDTASHPLSFTCHIDLAGSKEVNLALKRVDKSFANLVDVGDVTEDKGWTLTHVWFGTATKDEILYNDILNVIELDIVLPTDYKRCVFLQDNGVAWINTNYLPGDATGVQIVAKKIVDENGYPLGVYDSKNLFVAPFLSSRNTINSASYWNGTLITAWGTAGDSSAYIGELNFMNSRNASIRVRESSKVYSNTLPTMTVSSTKPLAMFGRYDNGNRTYAWKGRIYRVKISEGEEIVRDFIPCLNPSGKPCMYDIINGVEYINQGTGADFTYELYEE